MATYLKEFENAPNFDGNDNVRGITTPPITLLNLGRTNKPFHNLQRRCKVDYPAMTTILYIGEGITMYYPHTTSPVLTYKGNVQLTRTADGFYFSKKVSISDAIAAIEEHQKTQPVINCKICIIAGILAGRGISFVSSNMHNGIGWHVSSQRMLISSTTTQASLIQAIRITGNFNDNIPLTLYVDAIGREKVKLAYLCSQNLLQRAKMLSLMHGSDVKTSFLSQKLSKSQVGNMKFSNDLRKSHFTCIVPEAEKMDYRRTSNNPVTIGEILQHETMIKKLKDSIDQKHDQKHESKHESKHELKSSMSKWSNNFRKGKREAISTFLSKVDPLKKYTTREIIDLGVTCPNNILTNKYAGGSKGYGKLFQKNSDSTLQMRADVIPVWTKYFGAQ